MINFTKGLLCILFSLFCLYILESACFRLVENYANWRLTLAWGKPSEAAFNSILKKLPLDHFVRRPTDLPKPQHLGYWVGEEDHSIFVKRVLHHILLFVFDYARGN